MDNQLTSLPETISGLQNLKELELYSNSFTKFPKNLETLSNLVNLSLGENKIDDVLPESLNQLKKLKTM